VDFSTGAIYMPGSSRSSLDIEHAKIVRFDASHYTSSSLETAIKNETGYEVKFSQPELKAIRVSSKDDIKANLAGAFGSDSK
jgi:hypothetical protein